MQRTLLVTLLYDDVSIVCKFLCFDPWDRAIGLYESSLPDVPFFSFVTGSEKSSPSTAFPWQPSRVNNGTITRMFVCLVTISQVTISQGAIRFGTLTHALIDK